MRRTLSLAVAGTLLVGGCGPRSREDTADGPSEMLDALCDAQHLADRGDTMRAEATFIDRAHARIHALAAEARDDRASVATMLEAKHRLEAAIRDEVPGPELAALFGELRAATATVAKEEPVACA